MITVLVLVHERWMAMIRTMTAPTMNIMHNNNNNKNGKTLFLQSLKQCYCYLLLLRLSCVNDNSNLFILVHHWMHY